jgi:DHA2 family multidrug resistance protein-like MFS transporter
VLPLELDVRDQPAVEHAVGSLPDEFVEIDVLVNNAGLAKGLEPAQEAVQRGIVGHVVQAQRRAQLTVLGQAHLGFTERPVLITHEAQPRQQLRLGKSVCRTRAAVGRQRRLPEPLLDLSLFGHRTFTVAVLTNLLSIFALLGLMFFLPQYLQLVVGMSPLTAALWLLPMAGATITGALLAPAVARRLPLGVVIGGGMLVAAAGFAVGLFLTSAGEIPLILATGILVGAGIGMAETLTNDVIIATAPPERAGAAASISETAYEFGAAMGIAVLGTIGLARYRAQLADAAKGVPADAVDAAGQTLGAGVEVAGHLEPAVAAAFLDVVGEAFTSGMVLVFAVAAAVATYNGIQALVTLRATRTPRRVPTDRPPYEKLSA